MSNSNLVQTGQLGAGHPQAIGTFPSFSTVNFYAGNKLSRLSWLRQSAEYLNDSLNNPSARFIVLSKLNPLVHSDGSLATLKWSQLKPSIEELVKSQLAIKPTKDRIDLFGPKVFELEGRGIHEKAFDKATQGIVPPSLVIVFLGADESELSENSLPGELAKKTLDQSNSEQGNTLKSAGVPYFAISLSYRPPEFSKDEILPLEKFADSITKNGNYDFVDTRSLAQAGTWPLHHAAIVAQARSLIDWNERQNYCPACGRRQYSLWAGWKRACASSMGNEEASKIFSRVKNDEKGDCPTTSTLSNFCYPRTDPTVIMAIVSPDNEKILLGRQSKWPPKFYSCLAGFLEPSESIEEAVRREIYEESGVHVGNVIYHSSQPWPFPANLMIGAIGQAIKGKDNVRLDLDNELQDAKWFTRQEILNIIEHSSTYTLTRKDIARMDKTIDQKTKNDWDKKDSGSVANVIDGKDSFDNLGKSKPEFRIPGSTAIAHVLISAWAKGEAHFPTDTPKRGKI